MSASIQNPAEQLQQAALALDAVQKALDYSLADLKERSQKADGKISAALLDHHQLVSYDLALSCAEVTGARFGLDYAKRAREAGGGAANEPTLEERFALLFTAEALQAVRNRLSTRPTDFGLNDQWLSATVDHVAVRQFCHAQLPAERVAELGQLMRAQDGVTGAYLLDDHHEMMRETFRRVAEEVVMPLAEEVLTQQPGAAVVYDIKCSWHLTRLIERLGGQPILWKTGHSLIKAKMRETGALLGGEMAGHFVHADDWFGFDDAFYAAARLLRLLARHGVSSAEFFAAYPTGLNTPELRLDMAEGEPFAFMARLTDQADFGTDARIITLDGLRVEFPHGWGLVRASNTTPSLTLRFEADDPAAMTDIQDRFRRQLLALQQNLALPF